jgi:HlyD family secretion protein
MNRRLSILIALAVVFAALLAGCGAAERVDVGAGAPTAASASAAVPQTIEGAVVPRQYAVLNFPATAEVVAELYVAVGDQVAAGAPLARLDTRALQLKVEQSRAALAQAQAQYDKLRAPASAATIAASKAQLRQAQAQLQQTRGSVTRQDVAAAQAQLAQARAAQAELESGPKAPDLQSAHATLDQAQANLQSQRDSLSLAKTNAAAQRDQAADALTQAQSRYATAKANWDYVQQTGTDPAQPTKTSADGKTKANKLNDTQRQQYYDAFVQAEAALHSAERAVQAAVAVFDTARQQEVTGIAAAEARVSDSQAALARTEAGAEADQLAAARAQVAQAQANLVGLQGTERAATIDAATAAVALAQANLDRLREPPAQADLDAVQAAVAQAQAGLHSAELAVEQTTLRAPFAATVAEINLRAGEVPNAANTVASGVPAATSGAIVLADTAHWQVETTDLTELAIASIHEGDRARVTFDGIAGLEIGGTVARIKPIGADRKGDMTYTVVVALDHPDARLRWNMTAVVAFDPR